MKSYTWRGTTLYRLDWLAEKQFSTERTEGCPKGQGDHGPAVGPCRKEGQQLSELQKEECWQQVKGDGPSFLLECLVKFLAAQYKRDLDVLEGVQQRLQHWLKALSQPGEEEASTVYKYLAEEWVKKMKQAFLSGAQW